MSILDIFKKKNTSNIKNETFTFNDVNKFLEAWGLNSGDVSPNKLNSATYYACMQIRCNSISKLPLKIFKDTDLGIVKASDHYLYDILKTRPNPYMSTSDFLFATEFQKLEYGNAFIYMLTKRGKISELYLLDSQNVTIYLDDGGILGKSNAIWYVYKDKNGQEYKLNHKEVLHLKNFSKDGIIGTPIKKYLLETIENEQYASKFINNYWKNGLHGRAVLNYTGDLEDTKVENLRSRFEKMSSGLKNAGRIIPIPLGFQLQEFNTKLVDSQFFELQGLNIRHIANAFGVKLFQLNDLERSTYGNIETQSRIFYTETLQNVLTQYEQEFNYKLLTTKEQKDGYFFKFNVDSILRSDFKSRMEGYSIAVQNGIYTPSECRELEDKSFIKGSDILVFNGNMIPITMAGQQWQKGGDNSEK